MKPRAVKKKRSGRGKTSPLLLSQILPKTLAQSGLEKDYYKWQIFGLWDRIVGKNIALHAQPVRMARGLLQVVVSHSTWMQELQFMKRELIDRLNREMQTLPREKHEQLPLHLTPIKEIRFFLGTIPQGATTKSAQPKKNEAVNRPVTPQLMTEAAKATANIADEELKALLQQLWINTQQ